MKGNRAGTGYKYPKGSSHPSSKLTEADVVEILRMVLVDGKKHIVPAKKFGVTRVTISLIVNGRTWKSVPRPVIVNVDDNNKGV